MRLELYEGDISGAAAAERSSGGQRRQSNLTGAGDVRKASNGVRREARGATKTKVKRLVRLYSYVIRRFLLYSRTKVSGYSNSYYLASGPFRSSVRIVTK